MKRKSIITPFFLLVIILGGDPGRALAQGAGTIVGLGYSGGFVQTSRSCPCSPWGGRVVTTTLAPSEIPARLYVGGFFTKKWTKGQIIPENPFLAFSILPILPCLRFSWKGCRAVGYDVMTLHIGFGVERAVISAAESGTSQTLLQSVVESLKKMLEEQFTDLTTQLKGVLGDKASEEQLDTILDESTESAADDVLKNPPETGGADPTLLQSTRSKIGDKTIENLESTLGPLSDTEKSGIQNVFNPPSPTTP